MTKFWQHIKLQTSSANDSRIQIGFDPAEENRRLQFVWPGFSNINEIIT